jgi:hypothetical protein
LVRQRKRKIWNISKMKWYVPVLSFLLEQHKGNGTIYYVGRIFEQDDIKYEVSERQLSNHLPCKSQVNLNNTLLY